MVWSLPQKPSSASKFWSAGLLDANFIRQVNNENDRVPARLSLLPSSNLGNELRLAEPRFAKVEADAIQGFVALEFSALAGLRSVGRYTSGCLRIYVVPHRRGLRNLRCADP